MANERLTELERILSELDSKRAVLIQEISLLRSSLLASTSQDQIQPTIIGRSSSINAPITPDEKLNLFLKLFRCREDVYPKRWENNKTNKQGYSPACDFDESTWKEDVLAFKQGGRELGLDIAVEKFRSGNGAHAWLFFEEHVPARLARTLGTLFLAKCSEFNPRLSLDSYDRFFPSQDYLPKGGFGNLIALPLQKNSRDAGNSCFIDDQHEISENIMEHIRLSRLEKSYTFDNVISNHGHKN